MTNVHKDLHGALSFGVAYVEARHGPEALRAFLTGLADTVYAPLAADLRARGLPALEDHWRRVFEQEGGRATCVIEDGVLTVDVAECPAIAHMKAQGYAVAEHFCATTRWVNEAVCARAGYACSLECGEAAGRCVQRFWRAGP